MDLSAHTLQKNSLGVVSMFALVLYNSFNSWGWLESRPEIKRSLDIFSGDVRDPHGVKQAMKGCDVVFHLAALIGIPYSYHSPDTYIDTNVKGTLNIVQAARELGVAKVLHTSTSEVYGTARFVPITEEHPLQGQSPYSPAKSVLTRLPCPLSFLWHACRYRPASTLRSSAISTRRHSDRYHPDCFRRRKIKLGAMHPTRFYYRIYWRFIAESDKTVGEVINIGSD